MRMQALLAAVTLLATFCTSGCFTAEELERMRIARERHQRYQEAYERDVARGAPHDLPEESDVIPKEDKTCIVGFEGNSSDVAYCDVYIDGNYVGEARGRPYEIGEGEHIVKVVFRGINGDGNTVVGEWRISYEEGQSIVINLSNHKVRRSR